MNARPLLLDAFCGAGGAAKGYHDAGWAVLGVDIAPQPHYPFPFIQAEAIDFITRFGHRFDARHASPPCQFSSALTKGTNKKPNAAKGRVHVNLIPHTRAALDRIGGPYVIENVQGSELRRDLTLCGEMFGLGVIRHRYFELGNWGMPAPAHVPHRGRVSGWRHGERFDGPYVAVYGDGGGKGSVADWQQAMGIDWTDDKKELAEAIPPRYTALIGHQMMDYLTAQEARSA